MLDGLWARGRVPVAVIAVLSLVSLSCGGDSGGGTGPTGPTGPTVTSIQIGGAPASLQVGDTATVTATVRDQNNAVMAGRAVTWSSTNSAVLSVSPSGLLTATGAGNASVRAAIGSVSDEKAIAVALRPIASIEIVEAPEELELRDTLTLTAVLKDAGGNELTGRAVTWTSTDPSVLSVTESGFLTAHTAGDAEIQVSADAVADTTEVTVHPWAIADEVVVVDSTVLSLLSDSTERANGDLRFEVLGGATPPEIEVGDILVGIQSGGFLRRVETVSVGGGLVTTTTSDATLVEAITDGAFQTSVRLGTDDAIIPLTPGLGGLVYDRSQVTYLDPNTVLTPSGISFKGDLCNSGAVQCPVGLRGRLILPQADIDFTPDFDVGGSMDNGEVADFHAIATGSLSMDAEVNLGSAGGVNFTGSRSLVTITRPTLFSVGPIPVAALIKFQLKLGFTVDVSDSIAFTMKVSGSAETKLGGEYTKAGGWNLVNDLTTGGSASEPSLGGKVKTKLKVWLTPSISIVAYEVAGPFVSWGPFGEGSATLQSAPSPTGSDPFPSGVGCNLNVKAGLDGKVGMVTGKIAPGISWGTSLPEVLFYEENYSCPLGDVAVTVNTIGADPDPDGYTIGVAGEEQTVGVNGSVLFEGIVAGSHQIALTGVANRCSVASNPQQIDVSAGQTSNVSFSVECGETTGTLRVSTNTTGLPSGGGGYEVTVDGTQTQPIPATGSTTFDQMATGSHTVQLGQVAGNCTVTSGASQNATVQEGQTADVVFDVECVSNDLTITTQTTGQQQDPDGYTVDIDDGAFSQGIGVNDSAVFGELDPGSFRVELKDVAPNCTVSGSNPRTVTLEEGGTQETFQVACVSGSLIVEVSTQGDPGVETYTVTVDDTDSRAIAVGGNVQFSGLTTGEHSVELSDVPQPCVVLGENPRTANVPETINFSVDCTPQSGTIYYRNGVSIYAMNDDGTGRRVIVPDAWVSPHVRGYAVSDDGSRLAWVRLEGAFPDWKFQLWVANSDGSGAQKISESDLGMTIGPDAWSPDGQKLALITRRGGPDPFLDGVYWDSETRIVVMDAQSGSFTELPNTWGNCRDGAAWSPDGTLIAANCFTLNSTDPFENGCPKCKLHKLLVVMPAGGGSLVAVTNGDYAVEAPTWAPDGKEVSFRMGNRDGSYPGTGYLHRITMATGFRRGVTGALAMTGSNPTWSPEGLRIAFDRIDSWLGQSSSEVFIIDADGTTPVNLTRSSDAHESMPIWIPGG
jgi:Tol biopolymer transport system component